MYSSARPGITGTCTRAGRKDAARELISRVGEEALALASRCGGVALDEFGFPVNSPDDLLPPL